MDSFTLASLVLTCFMTAESTLQQPILYNSTTACFRGSEINQIYSANCQSTGTNDVGLIAVRRVFYGAQPDSHLCEDTDPASVCCSPKPDRDCFFATEAGELPPDVVEGCSGYPECHIQAKKKFTGTTCPLPSLFMLSSFTTYSFIEYQCVNVGLLTDICHQGITKSQKELYINSNVLHINTEYRDTSCTCRVSTSCGATIIFEAVDIRLSKESGACVEELVLSDDEEVDVKKRITCSDQDLNDFNKVFESRSNSVTLNLTISGNHTGKLWLRMKSSWPNASVEVHCGSTLDLAASEEEHVCLEPTTTTTSTTSTTSTTTTTPEPTTPQPTTTTPLYAGNPECNENSLEDCAAINKDESLQPGVIGGIVAAGVLILLVIILILVLIFRRHKRQPEHVYDVPSPPNTDYETLRYYNPPRQSTKPRNSYDNPSYEYEKPHGEGATGHWAEMDQHSLPQYENNLHDSVMVMPKGAVM